MSIRDLARRLRLKFVSAPDLFVGMSMCLIVGLVSGASAALLRWLIQHMSHVAHSMMQLEKGNWMLILLPVAGIVCTGIFTRYILRDDIEHASDKINDRLHRGITYISPKLIFGPIVASTMTLGFGGSAGAEGPIATVGAALGGNLSRLIGLPDHKVRVLIACGAAAGIAGIFQAPVGGMLYALEYMGLTLTTIPVIGILATCMVASLTAYVLSGCVPDLSLTRFVPQSLDYLPAVVLLGLCCGFYSLYYNYTGHRAAGRLVAIGNPWMRNVVSGLWVGVLLFLFPALYGEGYEVVNNLMNRADYTLGDYSPLYVLNHWGDYGLLLIGLGLLMAKGVAAFSSNSGGGVAGDFAPTLFAGAIAGYLFVMAAKSLFGVGLPMPVFVLGGMAAVMGGTIGAPLMAIFLTIEMTASYEYLLPVSLAGMVSFCVVKFYKGLI